VITSENSVLIPARSAVVPRSETVDRRRAVTLPELLDRSSSNF